MINLLDPELYCLIKPLNIQLNIANTYLIADFELLQLPKVSFEDIKKRNLFKKKTLRVPSDETNEIILDSESSKRPKPMLN